MTAQVDIANLALAAIGTRSTITSLTESSVEAKNIRLQYDNALDCVLAAAHWNFARKQVALALLKDGTASPPDDVPQPWVYEYGYPSDCVHARYMMPQFSTSEASASIFGYPTNAGVATGGTAVRFIVSSDVDDQGNDNKVILANQQAAVLVYTKRMTNPSLYDPQFIRALSCYLGALVAIALTGDKKLAQIAFDIADAVTKSARATNGNEGVTVVDSIPEWISARGYESSAAAMGQVIQAPVDLSFIT